MDEAGTAFSARSHRYDGPAVRLVSCLILDHPNELSHNLKTDPIKPQNP
jgi:hypothetical protein